MGVLDDYEEEEGEQLYMLEVVVDRIGVREDRVAAAPDPVLPLMARIKFSDLPVMEVERNELLLIEDQRRNANAVQKAENPIEGLPEDWNVEERRDDVLVEVAMLDLATGDDISLEVRVPKTVVAAGEGLHYLLATAKQQLPPQAFEAVQAQVNRQLACEKGTVARISQHNFSSGKSCLFHMLPSELIGNMAEFPIKVQVYRSGSQGNEFVHTLIGEANVSLGMSFTKAVLLACTSGALFPTTANVDNFFPMVDTFDNETGDVHLFIRLSCFGVAPFQEEEGDEIKKKKYLQGIFKKEETTRPSSRLDPRYPWKKNLDMIPDRPAPKPRLQLEYEAPPPPPLPPFDFGKYFTNIPRCSPFTPPPCYRKSGDAPLPRCEQQMHQQLIREEHTKGEQTDAVEANATRLDIQNVSKDKPVDPECTCPSVPPELIPSGNYEQPQLKCTCATILKSLVSPRPAAEKELQAARTNQTSTPNKPTPQVQVKIPKPSQPQPLGDSDYEIQLTKTECGLEKKSKSEEKLVQPKSEKKEELIKETEEKAKNILNEEAKKYRKRTAKDMTTTLPNNSPKKNTATLNVPYDSISFVAGESVKKKKCMSPYTPTPGMYPGNQFGHRRCVPKIKPVPKHMGWLWTDVNFRIGHKGRGWIPGTISSQVNSIMNKAKDDIGDRSEFITTPGKQGGTNKFRLSRQRVESKAAEVTKYNPNLHVHKKEGYYYVTMMPVKTDSQEEAGEEVKPIEYKIDPKHPDGSGDESGGYYSDSSSSSNVKSYEMNFILPLAMKKRKMKVEQKTLGVQYNEADYIKKTTKKPVIPDKPEESEKKVKKDQKKKGKAKGKGKKK